MFALIEISIGLIIGVWLGLFGRSKGYGRQCRDVRPRGQSPGDRSPFGHGNRRFAFHRLGNGSYFGAFLPILSTEPAPGNERGRQGTRALEVVASTSIALVTIPSTPIAHRGEWVAEAIAA